MEIIFIAESPIGLGETIFIPVVPQIGFIDCETKDEEFTNIKGQTLNIIGGKGIRTFSFTSFFPSKKYNFVNWAKFRPPITYVKFFEKYRDLQVPVRVIVIDRYMVVLNMLCRYNFSYALRDKAGDIPYTLEVKEYIKPRKLVF